MTWPPGMFPSMQRTRNRLPGTLRQRAVGRIWEEGARSLGSIRSAALAFKFSDLSLV